MEDEVGHQFKGAGEILRHEGGIEKGLLLRRIGVDIAADVLHAVANLPGAAMRGTFKKHVLRKMRHAAFIDKFIARSRIHHISAIGDRRIHLQMRQPKSVLQRISLVFVVHHCLHSGGRMLSASFSLASMISRSPGPLSLIPQR